MADENFRTETIRRLARQVRQMEGTGGRPAFDRPAIPSGLDPLDRRLPLHGFPPGSVIEWLAESPAGGTATLALIASRPALGSDGVLIVVDPARQFYPAAAAGLGIDLDRVVLIRPDHLRQALWAVEQSLRCCGVAVTLAWLERGSDREFRRLQLAAETGGGLGMIVRPASACRQPCWAAARLLVRPAGGGQGDSLLSRRHGGTPCSARSQGPSGEMRPPVLRSRIELLFCRGGSAGEVFLLECDGQSAAETPDFHKHPSQPDVTGNDPDGGLREPTRPV